MDLQALSTGDDLYLYDGSFRARGSLSRAQRAAFGLKAPLGHQDPMGRGSSYCSAPKGNASALHTAPGESKTQSSVLRQASSSGIRDKRPPESGGCYTTVVAARRMTALRKDVPRPQRPARPLALEVHIPSGEVRCIVWRGRAFVSSRRMEGKHD